MKTHTKIFTILDMWLSKIWNSVNPLYLICNKGNGYFDMELLMEISI